MSMRSDPDAERIMECLRLGTSSPAIDDLGLMNGGLKASLSDPCLWSAVAGRDGHAAGLWTPSGTDGLGCVGGDHIGSAHNTPPPVQPVATVSRAPPPGFEPKTAALYLCPPPGLNRAEDMSDNEWLSDLQRN